MLTRMVPGLLEYVSPEFHPWQANDAPAIFEWQRGGARHLKATRRTAQRASPEAA